MFLRLAAKHPDERATPTRDFDELWHLHMLQPAAYYADCIKLIGRTFDHDGGPRQGSCRLTHHFKLGWVRIPSHRMTPRDSGAVW
jgi:hypothetical protein